MAGPLAEIALAAARGIASIEGVRSERKPDSVSILDVIVTLDADDIVIEAIGADGESLVPIARVARDAPADAAKIAVLNALGRTVARAIETGGDQR